MITLNDCIALCGLTEREGTRIAEHEHLPEVAILTYIKPNGPRCKTLRERLLSIAPLAGFPVTEQPKLRFAVGTFDSWPQLRGALCELRDRGLVLDSFNCLALQRLFAGKTLIAPNQEPVGVEALPFAEGTALIACTSGPLAACLRHPIESGGRRPQACSQALAPTAAHSSFPGCRPGRQDPVLDQGCQ